MSRDRRQFHLFITGAARSMISLRPYQSDAVTGVSAAFKRTASPLLVLPTGGGKTVIFSYLAQRITTAGKRVMILAHRDELLEQIWSSLRNFQVNAQIVAGGLGYDRRYMAHVASVFTVARRIDKIEIPDWLIIDEAHHVTPNTVWGKVIAALRERNPNLKILGVTATPCRLSGEGLGETFGEMVIGPTPAELINAGWLSEFEMYVPPAGERISMEDANRRSRGDYRDEDVNAAVDKPSVMGSPVKHYQKHCPGEPGLVFCRSVKTAQDVAERFRAAGFTSTSIDGTMDKRDRKNAVRDFGSGQLQVMTSCALVSEGFDIPAIRAGFDMNPTLSLVNYLQRCGRTLRKTPGDDRPVLLFDHAGNSFQPGFGLPDDDREWTLDGVKKRKKSEGEAFAVKQCPKCYMVLRPAVMQCPGCGNRFVTGDRRIEEVEGELTKVERDAAKKAAAEAAKFASLNELGKAKSLESLVALAQKKGYSEKWAAHVHAAREKKRLAKAAVDGNFL